MVLCTNYFHRDDENNINNNCYISFFPKKFIARERNIDNAPSKEKKKCKFEGN